MSFVVVVVVGCLCGFVGGGEFRMCWWVVVGWKVC